MSALMAQYLRQKTAGSFEIAELLQAKGHSGFAKDAAFDFVCGEVARMWGLQFNPSSSVIASVLSQEVIKVVTQRDHPGYGLFVYDSTH